MYIYVYKRCRYIYEYMYTDIYGVWGAPAAARERAKRSSAEDAERMIDVTIWGAGCRVQGSGFRVQGSGCRVQGAGRRVQGAGFRVQGAGCRVQVAGFRV